MSGRLQGKTALVTGAAQGIGRATALSLAREGARVLLTDLNAEGARELAAAINEELGAGAAFSARHDVTSESDWKDAVFAARETLGGLSVLVNNAGIAQLASVKDLSLEEWRRSMSVNADSVFLGCKYAPAYVGEPARLYYQSVLDRWAHRFGQFRRLQCVEGPFEIGCSPLRTPGMGHPS